MGIPYTRLPSSLIADVWNVNVKLLPLFENEETLEFVYSVGLGARYTQDLHSKRIVRSLGYIYIFDPL